MARKRYKFGGEELGLLNAIHTAPKDNAPRLVYSDWLEERDDPLGEFFRFQIGHARIVICGDEKRYCGGRERELLKLHKREWLRPLPRRLRPLLFARGLPLLQFRVDLASPRFSDLERLSPSDLDATLREVSGIMEQTALVKDQSISQLIKMGRRSAPNVIA